MNCSCCCTNVLDFCAQNICSDSEIDFDIKAQNSGVHKLVLDYLQMQITISADIDADENLIFPIGNLNESYQYTGEIYDPMGNRVVIRKNDVDYDCFKFKTVLNVAA